MRYPSSLPDALYPLLLAAADVLVGGILFREVSVGLGAVIVAFGVLVLCSAASHALRHRGALVAQLRPRAVGRLLQSR